MNVVHFSKELSVRAPYALSILYEEPSGLPVTLEAVLEAIGRREHVTVRPASESEMRRAEAYVVLAEIGNKIAEKMAALLDQDEPKVVTAKITSMRDALESVDLPFEMLDRQEGA